MKSRRAVGPRTRSLVRTRCVAPDKLLIRCYDAAVHPGSEVATIKKGRVFVWDYRFGKGKSPAKLGDHA